MSNFDSDEYMNPYYDGSNCLFGSNEECNHSQRLNDLVDNELLKIFFANNKIQLDEDEPDSPNMTTNYTAGILNHQIDPCKGNLDECEQNVMYNRPDLSLTVDDALIKDEEGSVINNLEMPSPRLSSENVSEGGSIRVNPSTDFNENSSEVTLMEIKRQTTVKNIKRYKIKKYKPYTAEFKNECMKVLEFVPEVVSEFVSEAKQKKAKFKKAASKIFEKKSIIVPTKYLKRWSKSKEDKDFNNTTFRIIGSGGKARYSELEGHLFNKFVKKYNDKVSRKCFLEEAEAEEPNCDIKIKQLKGVPKFSSGWINNFFKRCGGLKFVSKKECNHCKKD